MKTPQALTDLYNDLKERKLLPIIALLAVAIVAVPFALSTGSSPPSGESPTAEIVPADAPEAQAAVLAENPGLRNYRQRLDTLKTKNPFEQQFAAPELDAAADDAAAAVDAGSVAAGDATSVPGSDTGSGSSVGGSSGSSTTFDDTTVTDTTDTINVDTSPGEVQFYSFRLDVSYGVDGDVKKHKNVKVLDILSPVGAFIGASEGGERAYFTLSSDIVGVDGQGQCVPTPTDCEFLALKQGQATTLIYQPPDSSPVTAYKLAVDEIRLVKVKKPGPVDE